MPDLPSTMAGAPAPAISRFLDLADQSLEDASWIRLVLSHPTSHPDAPRRIEARLVRIRDLPALSLSIQELRRSTTRNLSPAELRSWLERQIPDLFASALLETTRKDWQLSAPTGRPARLVGHRPRSAIAPDRSHDLPRQGPFDDSARDWLLALDLIDADGRPLPSRADKYRQVLRYAEVLGHLLQDAAFPEGAPVRVADMGCGRGYLTFAAWQCLHRQRRHAGEVFGIEARPDLVARSQAIVDRLRLPQLGFRPGTIADTDPGPLDVLVALHACNTATDEAIVRGVHGGARLVLVAPCCHQELRPHLGDPPLFAPLFEHGIFAERFSEWLTDGLRLLALEAAGYRTKSIEFVASEHTPKNLLLAGIRGSEPPDSPRRSRARTQLEAIRAYFGLGRLAIDALFDRSP